MKKRHNARNQGGLNTKEKVHSDFDKWLERASHMSQAIVAILTLASLYFIVLPIYQKELLSEAIAKAELDLKRIKEDADWARTINTITNFIGYTSLECSTLLSPVSAIKIEDEFDMNITNCWENEFQEFESFKEIDKDKINEFYGDMLSVTKAIDKKRNDSKREFEEFIQAPEDYKYSPGELEVSFNKLENNFIPPREQKSFEEKRRNQAAKFEIVVEYTNFKTAEVSRLRGEWQSKNKTQQIPGSQIPGSGL